MVADQCRDCEPAPRAERRRQPRTPPLLRRRFALPDGRASGADDGATVIRFSAVVRSAGEQHGPAAALVGPGAVASVGHRRHREPAAERRGASGSTAPTRASADPVEELRRSLGRRAPPSGRRRRRQPPRHARGAADAESTQRHHPAGPLVAAVCSPAPSTPDRRDAVTPHGWGSPTLVVAPMTVA